MFGQSTNPQQVPNRPSHIILCPHVPLSLPPSASLLPAPYQAGDGLLAHGKVMDRVRNVQAVCSVLASRDHLLEKASLLMARVLLVYRVRRVTAGCCGEGSEKASLLMARALLVFRV